MKGLEAIAGAFVAELQTPIVPEPRESPFHDVAELAQTTAMGPIIHEGELASDSPRPNRRDVVFGPVGTVPLVDLGAKSRSAERTLDRRNRVQQLDGGRAVVHVRGRHVDDQGNPLSVG